MISESTKAALPLLLALGCAPARPARAEQPELDSQLAPATEGTRDEVPAAEQEEGVAPNPAAASAHFEELEVTGYPNALVWVPPHANERLPLVVISHGAGGGPEWHCQFWSEAVGDEAFLLCLAGLPLGNADGHYFPEHHTLGRIWRAGVAAFDAKFGARSTTQSNVYIGYSQGATMGAWVLSDHADRFDRALLIEGGYREWNVQRAKEFRQSGGQAIHLVCGTCSCFQHAKRAVRWLHQAEVAAELSHAPNAGHTPAGAVGEAARSALSWLRAR